MQHGSDFDTFVEEIEIVSKTFQIKDPEMEKETHKYTGAIRKNTSPPSENDYLPNNLNTVLDLFNKGLRVCVLMRGLPGSGKSFIAKYIVDKTVKNDDHIFSADKFFMQRGRYVFQSEKIPLAHEHTQRLFTQSASKGMSPIVVDNTACEFWEMYHYIQVAAQNGYHIEIMEPCTPWKFSEGKLTSKNSHGVPLESIKRMKAKYQTGCTVEQLLQSLNLQVVSQPKMRNIPPIVKESPKASFSPAQVPMKSKSASEFANFSYEAGTRLDRIEPLLQEVPVKDVPWQPAQIPSSSLIKDFSFDFPPQKILDANWSQLETKTKESEKPKQTDTAPQKKKKNKQNRTNLTPHRQGCPNENPSFIHIRECYPDINDSYLWDLFEQCKGDADWCVNLLCDENLVEKMDSGCFLSCNCFKTDQAKFLDEKVSVNDPLKQQKVQSPAMTKKELAEVSKKIDFAEWLETKEAIEKSITIGNQYYPDHVNKVKNWKKGPQPVVEALVINEQVETLKTCSTPEAGDELHELTIGKVLILELDEQYGGGLLKSSIDSNLKFPPKIFIKKSTAHQLYLEIMEAYYSQEEEMKLRVLKEDEELAKKLSELETNPKTPSKTSKNNGYKDSEIERNLQQFEDSKNNWLNEEATDDIALKMSKDKLIEMFPGLNKNDLMEIFAGNDYNFRDTISIIQDSLLCTPEERKIIEQTQKKVFNTPWKESEEKVDDKPEEDDKDGYTLEHLGTVENLRQEIHDHKEEQKVCYSKAQDAIQKKNYELATHLSNIANFHRMKAEEAKHQVANMMAGIHERTQSSNTTLDLHFLNLVEATTLLDTFLDKNISRLRAMKKPYEDLFIITGRGLHSVNGIATIKVKTKSRLRDRNLTSAETNPGLLRVKVFQQSKLTNEF